MKRAHLLGAVLRRSLRRSSLWSLVCSAALAGGCPLLPGPEDLADAASLEIIVTALEARDRVKVEADDVEREARAEGDTLTFTLALDPGAIEVRLEVERGAVRRCTRFDVEVPATGRATRSVDAASLPRCDGGEGEGEGEEGEGEEGEGEEGEGEEGEGEGEGEEGEGEGEACTDGEECDDALDCTRDDRCLDGACVGSWDTEADCGGCEDVDCSDVCSPCCAAVEGACDDVCGTCLASCGDDTCVCQRSTCARTARGAASTSLYCDQAVCVDDLEGLSQATLSCEAAACAVGANGVGQLSARCDDEATCVVRVENGDAELTCEDGSTCTLDCEGNGQTCTLDCAATASACSLLCEDVEQPCAPGEACACPST